MTSRLHRIGAVSSRSSEIVHVAEVADPDAARGTRVRAVCGQDAEVRWYPVGAEHAFVCRRCRRALGWPPGGPR